MLRSWVYAEQAPPANLSAYVQAIWSEAVGDRPDHPGARVLPDGCTDLVWISGRPPFVAGPATVPIITSAPPGSLVVGIRLRSGAAGAVLGAPAHVLRDASAPLSDLWGARSLDAVSRVEASESVPERRAAMTAMLLARLATVGPPDAAAMFVAGWLGQNPDAPLDRLPELTGLGERHLRRRFESAVGYGPKTLQRIVRFRRWLHLAKRATPEQRSLVDLAALAGYADQAHLTREARRLAGLPPAALLATYDSRPD